MKLVRQVQHLGLYVGNNGAVMQDPKVDTWFSGQNAPAPMTKTQAAQSFLDWVQARFPDVYVALSMSRPDIMNPQLSMASFGFGDATPTDVSATGGDQGTPTWYDNISKALTSIVPAYLQYDTQRQLLNVNLARAQQGLPPIDSSMLAPTVNVGVSPQLQQLGIIAIAAFIGIGLFTAFRRPRGR